MTLVSHPFTGREAEDFSPREAVDRFVPNRVWDEVRRPDNRLLLGGVGTGKSILLKRLSWPAMLTEPSFLQDAQFLAIYVDLRPLEFLDLPSETREAVDLSRPPERGADALVDYAAALLILRETLQTLIDTDGRSPTTPSLHSVFPTICSILHANLAINDVSSNSPSELLGSLHQKFAELRSMVSTGTFRNVGTLSDSPLPTLSATVNALATAVRRNLPDDWQLVFLLDQYESMHIQARFAINSLLRRANKSSFCTVIASRPFALQPFSPDGVLIPKEDFQISLVEYLPEDQDSYTDLLREILCRLLRSENPAIADVLFPSKPPLEADALLEALQLAKLTSDQRALLEEYHGFTNLARLSSSSIRSFLDICKECVLALGTRGPHWQEGIPPAAQIHGAVQASRDERSRVRSLPFEPRGSLYALVSKVATEIHNGSGSAASLPKWVTCSGDLEPNSPEAKLVARGFEDSVLQYCTAADVGFDVPNRWRVQALLAPALKVGVAPSEVVTLAVKDLKALVERFVPHPGVRESLDMHRGLTRVFLSTAFALSQDRIDFLTEAFAREGIELLIGRVVGAAQRSKIRDSIRSCDLTLVDVTDFKPNLALEMGLSLGMSRPVLLVRNKDEPGAPTAIDLDPLLKYHGLVDYSWATKDVQWAVNSVVNYWNRPRADFDLLKRPAAGGSDLRVKDPRPRTLFVYWPRTFSALWARPMLVLEGIARENGFKILTTDEAPEHLEEAEVLVWGISRSSHVLVDTSFSTDSGGAPDMSSFFALGYAWGERGERPILRTEMKKYARSELASVWSVDKRHYREWASVEELGEVVKDLTGARKRK